QEKNKICLKVEAVKTKIDESKRIINKAEQTIKEKTELLKLYKNKINELFDNSDNITKNFQELKKSIEENEKELENTLNSSRTKKQELKNKTNEIENLISENKQKKAFYESKKLHIKKYIQELIEELKNTNNDIDQLEKEIMIKNEEIKKYESIKNKLIQEFQNLKTLSNEKEKNILNIKKNIDELNLKINTLYIKIDSLKTQNPYYIASIHVLSKNIEGVIGMLGDLIDVKPAHIKDVMLTLGKDVYGIVVKNNSVAYNILDDFKKNGKGIIRIFVLEEIKKIKPRSESNLISVSTLISTKDEEIKKLIEVLLDGVYITGAGIVSHGIIEYAKDYSTEVIAVNEAKYQINFLENEVSELISKLKNLETEKELIDAKLEDILNEIKTKENTIEVYKNAIDQYSSLLKTTNEKKQFIVDRITKSKEEVAEIEKEIEKLENEINTETEKIEELKKLELEIENTIVKVEAEIRKTLNEKRVLWDIENYLLLVETIEKSKIEINEEEKNITQNKNILSELLKSIDALNEELEEIDRVLNEKKSLLQELESKAQKTYKIKEDILKEKSQLNGEMEKIKSQLEYIAIQTSEIKEFIEIDFNAEEYESLKSEFEAMDKNINWTAEKELEELNLKKINYETHIQDLEKSKNDLKKIIKENDAKVKERFLETLKVVQENFNELLKQMFDVAEGKIEIVENDESGELGIDIYVNIQGKKIMNLNQYSGGERSMIALTLLLSFFTANPAPFAVIDEGDSALDEPNILRFTKLIKYISDRYGTQFIIITHNKRTIESMECIYGFTMHKNGYSKILSIETSKELAEIIK
ncbi:MAG: hypothetical protein NZ870_00805, partial [bacterium]|nr:hypothetical protein [bacterium]